MSGMIIARDVWVHVGAFLTVPGLREFSLVSCQFHKLVFDQNDHTSNLIWKEQCTSLLRSFIVDCSVATERDPREKKQKISDFVAQYLQKKIETNGTSNFLELYQNLFCFSYEKISPSVNSLIFSKMNRSCVNSSSLKDSSMRWESIDVNCEMVPGYVYEFEFIVRHYERVATNQWMTIVGVSDDEGQIIRSETTSSFGEWIGHHGQGIGIILADDSIIHHNIAKRNQYYTTRDNEQPKTGDVIGIRFDMRLAGEAQDKELLSKYAYVLFGITRNQKAIELFDRCGSKIEFFINGVPVMTVPYSGLPGQQFWPSISLINKQHIEVRPGFELTNRLMTNTSSH